jgi:hypothetical protein
MVNPKIKKKKNNKNQDEPLELKGFSDEPLELKGFRDEPMELRGFRDSK